MRVPFCLPVCEQRCTFFNKKACPLGKRSMSGQPSTQLNNKKTYHDVAGKRIKVMQGGNYLGRLGVRTQYGNENIKGRYVDFHAVEKKKES